MGQDNGFDSESYKPLIAERVALPGEFVKKIKESLFSQSNILKTAAVYVEAGKFTEGTDVVQAELVKRGIGFEYVPKGTNRRGTRVENGHEVMILDDDFKDQPPAKKLWALLHRNMSLILQRGGKREDPKFMNQLLELDINYVEAARLGAKKMTDASERISVQSAANDIELMTNQKIIGFKNTSLG